MNDAIIYRLINKPTLQALLGSGVRFYAMGQVPQTPKTPYATYQLISEVDDNNLVNVACSASHVAQIDVWAANPYLANDASAIIKRLLRGNAYMTFKMNDFDNEVKLFRTSQRFDFIIQPD